MVNQKMLYLLASHPKYSHMNKRLSNFNVNNPKQKQLNRSREEHPALEIEGGELRYGHKSSRKTAPLKFRM